MYQKLDRARFFSGFEVSRVSYSRTYVGYLEKKARAYWALEILRALLKPIMSLILLGTVEPANKLEGFAKIWAR